MVGDFGSVGSVGVQGAVGAAGHAVAVVVDGVVVSGAQQGEGVQVGAAAEGPGEQVVDFAPVGGSVAAAEAAAAVA